MGSRFLRLGVSLALVVTALVWFNDDAATWVRDLTVRLYGTPHQRYAVSLKYGDLAHTDAGRAWLESAERSLASAAEVRLPRRLRLSWAGTKAEAEAFEMRVRRGSRYVAETEVDGDRTALFVDLFERDGDSFRHVASLAADERAVRVDAREDATYVIRVQSEIDRSVTVRLALHVEPTLVVPIAKPTRPRIQSFFGDPRDNGRRAHHGVDIFAPRGTPVVAAAGGIVTSVARNGLGGNVVWIARPGQGEAHYYAHLDRQLVSAGTFVRTGDVIGTVGTTGNARGTAPHLHFGIYTGDGPVDPLPYIAPRQKT